MVRRSVTVPDWAFWPGTRPVALWQAVALSLNFEPWERCPNNFGAHHFHDAQTEALFRKRWALIYACFQRGMMLSEFAAWATSVAKWAMPPELEMIAKAAHTKEGGLAETSRCDEAGKTTAVGLPRKEILLVNWPLRPPYTMESLSAALSDVPKWLKHARVAQGSPGKASALWNPALIAISLAEKRHANSQALTTFIRNNFSEWLDEWNRISER